MEATSVDIHSLYEHEIKSKRIIKEISLLQNQHLPGVTVGKPHQSSIGLHIPITLLRKNRHHRFQLRLDLEYPFMHPQVHCLDTSNPFICEARDLTYLFLQEGELWGPSIMLNRFAETLDEAVQRLESDSHRVLGTYFVGELYDRQELVTKGLSIFGASQHTWRLMLKHTDHKILAISQNVLLKLSMEDEAAGNRLKLQRFVFLSETKGVTSNTETKQFSITFGEGQTQTLYFTLSDRLDELLELVNPLQMVNRRVSKCEALNQLNQQLVRDYSYLVEYYSLRDQQQYTNYLAKMKAAISALYATKTQTSDAGGKPPKPQAQKSSD